MSYIFLQQYWWFIMSLLGGILVFLLFVQGGQSLITILGKTDKQRSIIVTAMGHKWELTFTTLVTFGGAFFASFPLFYSTSFGGAIYVWLAILICFVLQAVSYEYRKKQGNLLGSRTYETFLIINGTLGTFLLGAAVATLFTGGNFIVERANIVTLGGNNIISSWANNWHGLEAILDYRNVALGLALLFLARVLGIQYLHNATVESEIKSNSQKIFTVSVIGFLVAFLTFLVSILFSKGMTLGVDGIVTAVDNKYLTNLIEMPAIAAIMAIGVLLVLYSIWLTIYKDGSSKAIWFSGVGVVLTVTMLLLTAGYNNTSFYPSLVDAQSSLFISNSSSSYFTLKTMTYSSIMIPFVLAYIWYAWRQMNKKRITEETIDTESSY